MKHYYKVAVVMSTYNASHYLEEQLLSIINQDYRNLTILIRDDGSTNNLTFDILYKFQKSYNNIFLYLEENVGVQKSFLKLLNYAKNRFDFIFLSDQDDVWLADKISRALSLLDSEDKSLPLFYCSRQTLVDENLNFLGYSYKLPKYPPLFQNSLVNNVATGCTIAINNLACNILMKGMPYDIRMHDWWIYQIMSAFGRVVIDDESRILYRQHDKNIVGIKKSNFGRWKTRIKRLFESKYRYISKHAIQIYEIYEDDLCEEKKKILTQFFNRNKNFFKRINYIFFGRIKANTIIDNIIFRILILLNKV